MTNPVEEKMMQKTTQQPQGLSCNMEAMTATQRHHHEQLLKQLRKEVKQVKELPDGFAFGYVNDPGLFMVAAEFITLESRCCSFFRFNLEQEPEAGNIWLRITGPRKAKTIIKSFLTP